MLSRRSSCFAVAVTAAIIAWLPAPAIGGPQYNIVALDVVPGGLDSLAYELNDVGQVVGASLRNRSGNIGQSRPVVWDYSGVPHELWSDQVVGGYLADINNVGEMVGQYGSGSFIPLPTNGVPYGRAFYWSESSGRVDIGFEPVGNSQAVAINEQGYVVGTSERLEYQIIDGTPQPLYVPHAFAWSQTYGILEIPTLGGRYNFAAAINELGNVVGYAETPDEFERAFIWDEREGMRALPTINGGETRAVAINDLGQVLGGEIGVGGLIWDVNNGGITVVPGGLDINNLGQVVGGGSVGNPTIWDQTNGTKFLSELIPLGSGWQLEFAFAINDAGDIVGYGLLDGNIRAFLMTPIPEPVSWQLGALATTILAIRILSLRQRKHTNTLTR